MAVDWKVVLPLHPDYRTLPMVWYVPPLSPIQSAANAGQIGAPDPAGSARRALAVRELLLQRAGELGLLENGVPCERVTFASGDAEGALIERVLDIDAAIFGKSATRVLPQLIATRHGFHIVLVERRIAGRTLPFEAVEARIAEHLRKRVQQRAMHQYVKLIAGQAGMADAQLGTEASPLVQ